MGPCIRIIRVSLPSISHAQGYAHQDFDRFRLIEEIWKFPAAVITDAGEMRVHRCIAPSTPWGEPIIFKLEANCEARSTRMWSFFC